MTSDIDEITKWLVEFRDRRNWRQFHNAKDLALAVSVEASELNELFLWKKSDEANRTRIAEELADIFIYVLLLAHEENIDVLKAVRTKLRKNASRYPVKKSAGNAKKYTEL